MKVYVERRDWWVGYFRGDEHHYVCPLPCIVIRWRRRAVELLGVAHRPESSSHPIEVCPACKGTGLRNG